MKKIAKLTWLHNGNYGSILQAYALHKVLKDNNFDVTDIDYNASNFYKVLNLIENRNSLLLFEGKFKELINRKKNEHSDLFANREIKFKNFVKKYIKTSPIYTKPKQLKKIANEYDIYICGSDQIWSPMLMNPIYYLDFVPSHKIKIAYSPSFGVLDATSRKKKKIKSYLEKFDYISVRENEGKKLVFELIEKNVVVNVDPTMLIDKISWSKLITSPIRSDDYILVYLLSSNIIYIEAIKKFAKLKNLEVVIIPTIKGPFNTGFDERIDVGPEDWLNYISNAKYVFTDSFHGCIFSLIFEKEFVLFKRFSEKNKNSENSRIFTLSALLKIDDRVIDENNIEQIFKLNKVDFSKIRGIINENSEKSMKWLIDILNNIQ